MQRGNQDQLRQDIGTILPFINRLSEMGIVARFQAQEGCGMERENVCMCVYTQLVHKAAE